MDAVDILGLVAECAVLIGLVVLLGFYHYWLAKFLKTTPDYLKRIAEALEKIAEK